MARALTRRRSASKSEDAARIDSEPEAYAAGVLVENPRRSFTRVTAAARRNDIFRWRDARHAACGQANHETLSISEVYQNLLAVARGGHPLQRQLPK
jgi:hypothetical protein